MRLFFIFFLFTFSFAINDYIVKPSKRLTKAYLVVPLYPESLSSNVSSDDYNIFKYKGHFRVIYGKDYDNNETIVSLAKNILDIADYVWSKEIEDFGFRAPRNSSRYYIDIYIGNTKAFNKAENSYVTINNYYAGYAAAYYNGTPYFVINPSMSLDLLKVTIAHEFFHTIQYAYGLDIVNNDIWYKNIWFLEATATMMEDEVFDDVNDYINYLNYYLPYINYSLDFSNGSIEYGKVLFAKFLRNKFGIDFIKEIFENYETNETLLADIKQEVSIYDDFDNVMLDYGVCLANLHTCYKDGKFFPNVNMNMLGISKDVGEYGVVLFNSGSNNYLISSSYNYLQSNFRGDKNILDNINDNGLVFIAKRSMNTDFLVGNVFRGYELKKGWNLIANIFNEDIDFGEFDVDFIWVLRDKYCAYSNSEELYNEIKELNYSCKENYLKPGEGAWVYVSKDKNLTILRKELISFSGFKNGIVGFSSVVNLTNVNDYLTIWDYNEGNWSYFSNIRDFNYSKLNKIIPAKGYFISK